MAILSDNQFNLYNSNEQAVFAAALNVATRKAVESTNRTFNDALTRETVSMARENSELQSASPRFGSN